MKNVLIIDNNGILQMLSSTDDGSNSFYLNGSEIPASQWVGAGNYIYTSGGHTYTIAKAADSAGNYQLIKDSDYLYHFSKIITQEEKINSMEYHVGDIINAALWTSGTISSGKASLFINIIPITKNIGSDISGCTISKANIVVRQNGNYIFSNGNTGVKNILQYVNACQIRPNGIHLTFTNLSSAWDNANNVTNNDTASVYIEYTLKLT